MEKKENNDIPLWTHDGPEICRYCAYGKRIAATEDVFCEKYKKMNSEDFSCKKFVYDILKKEVRRVKPRTSEYSSKQFEI